MNGDAGRYCSEERARGSGEHDRVGDWHVRLRSFSCVSACDEIGSARVVGHSAVVEMGNPSMRELHVVLVQQRGTCTEIGKG